MNDSIQTLYQSANDPEPDMSSMALGDYVQAKRAWDERQKQKSRFTLENVKDDPRYSQLVKDLNLPTFRSVSDARLAEIAKDKFGLGNQGNDPESFTNRFKRNLRGNLGAAMAGYTLSGKPEDNGAGSDYSYLLGALAPTVTGFVSSAPKALASKSFYGGLKTAGKEAGEKLASGKVIPDAEKAILQASVDAAKSATVKKGASGLRAATTIGKSMASSASPQLAIAALSGQAQNAYNGVKNAIDQVSAESTGESNSGGSTPSQVNASAQQVPSVASNGNNTAQTTVTQTTQKSSPVSLDNLDETTKKLVSAAVADNRGLKPFAGTGAKVEDNFVNRMDRRLNPRKAARLDQEQFLREQEAKLRDMQMQLLNMDHLDPESKARLDAVNEALRSTMETNKLTEVHKATGAMSPGQHFANSMPSAVTNLDEVLNSNAPVKVDKNIIERLAFIKDPVTLIDEIMKMAGGNSQRVSAPVRQLKVPAK